MIEMVPVTTPAACGENVTVSRQDPLGPTVEQAFRTENVDRDEAWTERTLSDADPSFLTRMVCGALVPPTTCCEKSSERGWRLIARPPVTSGATPFPSRGTDC